MTKIRKCIESCETVSHVNSCVEWISDLHRKQRLAESVADFLIGHCSAKNREIIDRIYQKIDRSLSSGVERPTKAGELDLLPLCRPYFLNQPT